MVRPMAHLGPHLASMAAGPPFSRRREWLARFMRAMTAAVRAELKPLAGWLGLGEIAWP
jgi:hypothetical protein